MIRINPHTFRDKKGKIVPVTLSERMDALKEVIERIPSMEWPVNGMQMKMVYLFYKEKAAEEWVEESVLKDWFERLADA